MLRAVTWLVLRVKQRASQSETILHTKISTWDRSSALEVNEADIVVALRTMGAEEMIKLHDINDKYSINR